MKLRFLMLGIFFSYGNVFAQEQQLDVGDIVASSMTAFYVSVEKGYFKEERLNVRQISMTGDVMVKAVVSGSVPFGMGFGAPALAAANGLPVKIIIGMLQKPVYSLYAGSAFNGRTPKDLRGKKLGITGFGAATEHAARAILAHHGLEPLKDVALVPLRSATNMVVGIQTGAVDAAILWPPHSFRAEKMGMVKLEYLGDILDMPNSGLFTSEQVLRSQPDLVRRFLRSTVKGINFLRDRTNRQSVLQTLMRKFKLDSETASASYDFIIQAHTEDGLLADAAIKKFLEVGLPPEHRSRNIDDIFDFGPLREVLNRRF
jgi:ABC-type nitrate/sulfonate/bicarbonate transport system substrate-binding protein